MIREPLHYLRAARSAGLVHPMPGPLSLAGVIRAGAAAPSGLGRLARVSAARWPARTVLHDDLGALAYRDLIPAADAVAARIHADHGTGPGDVVGVLCRNGRGFLFGLLAAVRLGADVVLLNTDFRGQALAASIDTQQISVIVCDAEFSSVVAAVRPQLPTLTATADAGTCPPPPVPRREGRLILLTSGTTGTPRGVARDPSVTAILGMCATVIDRTGIRSGTRTMIAVPFFHAFGLATLCLTVGLGGAVIAQSRFDPTETVELCRRHRADSLMVVPAMIARILDAQLPPAATSPRIVVSGGSALLPSLAARFTERFGDVLFNGYGSSEAALATFATPSDMRRQPGTVGRAVAGTRVAVVDEHGREAPRGTVGRIFAGGASTVGAYADGSRRDEIGGLIATGDLGSMDADGLLQVLGRTDDMIVSGGENVYPRAVENALHAHPAVVDACAIGVPDEQYGQRLVVLAAVVDRGLIDADGLADYLQPRVACYERPRSIHLVEEIPRNAAGKVDRTAARALLEYFSDTTEGRLR